MKKIIAFLLFVLCTTFANSQIKEGNYYILHPKKNRNTGEMLTSAYFEEGEIKHMGKILKISVKKGGFGMPYLFDPVASEKLKKSVFHYQKTFLVKYDENSLVSFNVIKLNSNGKLEISEPNYFAKDNSLLANMNDAKIQEYAQKVYEITK